VNYCGGSLKESALHWCIRNDNYLQMLKLLLYEGKADPSLKSINGCDGLFIAVMHASLNSAFILLHEMGVDPNTINNEGETPLYW
jgi:ankyrin repeat protein